MNRLQEIEKRKQEIRELLEGEQEVDFNALEKELRALNEEKEKIEKRQRLLEEARTINEDQNKESRTIETFNNEPEKREDKDVKVEKRGQALKENRAVTVGSSDIVLPKHTGNDIRPTFNEVSSLIDRVNYKLLLGGESYQQPYLKGYGTGGYTAEGTDYTTADVIFGYADINKAKVTAYSEDTEEVLKLPAADYDAEVIKGISVASRKQISREILIGAGTTNTLTGIFSTNATAIDAATDIEIDEINNNTLDEIVFSYGGDEDVEDAAVLILNKNDLKAFVKLRDSNGNRIHRVVSNGNTGTIDGIPFIINSACLPINNGGSGGTAGDYAMAYGSLSNYGLTIFSEMDVQRSTDFKFKQGMIAHKGSVFVGGNVISKNGFVRVKRATTQA
ncbi:phage major capsid protein [Alkalihalobacillus sp. BA299]|uniref:phage major capsid protein n=1 Tax=Alkalihalobacillus sp. BA299 TaxID=2815938 RepID=UPI001ADD0EA0|nr:phage major capsid protein [Alkalihalobacillus sp. BA299]